MHRLGKWMRALALVGQLGFCIITPPLVLVYHSGGHPVRAALRGVERV